MEVAPLLSAVQRTATLNCTLSAIGQSATASRKSANIQSAAKLNSIDISAHWNEVTDMDYMDYLRDQTISNEMHEALHAMLGHHRPGDSSLSVKALVREFKCSVDTGTLTYHTLCDIVCDYAILRGLNLQFDTDPAFDGVPQTMPWHVQ